MNGSEGIYIFGGPLRDLDLTLPGSAKLMLSCQPAPRRNTLKAAWSKMRILFPFTLKSTCGLRLLGIRARFTLPSD